MTNYSKKSHRQDRTAQKGQNGEQKTDQQSDRGFWPSDFNQRTSEEKFSKNEALFKTKYSNQSASKNFGEILEAMGECVSAKELDELRIKILDLFNKLQSQSKNNKLKGIIQSYLNKLQLMIQGKVIEDPYESIEGVEARNDNTKFQVGDCVEIVENNERKLFKILEKDKGNFKLKNFVTGDISEKRNENPSKFLVPNPIFTNPDKIKFNQIKSGKIEAMKTDISNLRICTTRQECADVKTESSLGRLYMLFKYTSLLISSGGQLNNGVFGNDRVNLAIFKMYFKIFYEDVISVSSMFSELEYLLSFWNDFDGNSSDFIQETADMVNNCFHVFHAMFNNDEYANRFLKELFHSLSGFIPPLKRTKFILDPFQVEVCNLITNKKSFLLVAPTSSGKSVLSTYVLQHWKDGLILIVVPKDSDVLAWQFAAKIEKEMGEMGNNTFVPIITENYKSVLQLYTEKKDEELDKVKNSQANIFDKIATSKAIVGTASEILNILPEIKKKIAYVIFDEIHMIDKEEGKDMEFISKIVGKMNQDRIKNGETEIPFMGLSATISNPEFLQSWYQTIGWSQVEIIRCTQRFFNLQLHTTTSAGEVVDINPMSMVSEHDLINHNGDKSAPILSKEIDFTAADVWNLCSEMVRFLNPDAGSIWLPEVKFQFIIDQNRNRLNGVHVDNQGNVHGDILVNQMFELKDVKEYGEQLISVLVDYANNEVTRATVSDLLGTFVPLGIDNHGNLDLFDLFKNEVSANRTPTIAFMVNPSSCIRFAQSLYKGLRQREDNTNDPDVAAKLKDLERINNPTAKSRAEKKKEEKAQRDEEKKMEAEKEKKRNQKECMNKEKGGGMKSSNSQKKKFKTEKDRSIDYAFWKPLLKNTFLTDKESDDISGSLREIVDEFNELKIYKSNDNGIFWLIDLLQYGVGVYVKGLAGHYVRLVQSLALQKKIKIVISDKSLMFGVSMPFRTAIIFRDWYDTSKMPIDPMMLQQMGGRAGRRGADSKGHIIISGFEWNEIKRLCVKEVPKIEGKKDNYLWTTESCNYLSGGKYGSDVLDRNFLNKESNDRFENFYKISGRVSKFIPDNVDMSKYHRMMWRYRYSSDSAIVPHIINPLISTFFMKDPDDENHQVELAYFLSHFIHICKSNTKDSLKEVSKKNQNAKIDSIIKGVYLDIKSKAGVTIDHSYIDSRKYKTISNNKLQINSDNINEIAEFKEEFYRFANKIIDIQHFMYYSAELYDKDSKDGLNKARLSNIKKVCTLMGKLVTRLWWEYQTDPSTLIESYNIDDLSKLVSDNNLVVGSELNTDHLKYDVDPVQFNINSQILLNRNLRSVGILGDGNCLFRAVSKDEYGSEDRHSDLRQIAMDYITSEENRGFYSEFIQSEGESFEEYVTRLRQDGEHADQYEINALQQIIRRPIYVFSDLHQRIEGNNIDNDGNTLEGKPILLNYFDEIDTEDFIRPGHYELIEGDVSISMINELQTDYTSESVAINTLTESEENNDKSEEDNDKSEENNESSDGNKVSPPSADVFHTFRSDDDLQKKILERKEKKSSKKKNKNKKLSKR